MKELQADRTKDNSLLKTPERYDAAEGRPVNIQDGSFAAFSLYKGQ
ncbi:hypothetical protein [Lachnoclostridium edouardi]|nr:hypothetical protein [Lachnoclostridium edouardi]MDO4277764.1 hypothetical protein [Lachnoclostridium edouardi]